MVDREKESSQSRGDALLARRRYSPLVIVLLATAAGIIADRLWPMPICVWFAATLLALIAWFLTRRIGWENTTGLLILLAVMCLAGGRHHQRWSLFDAEDIGFFRAGDSQNAGSSRPVCLRATVIESPSRIPAPPYDPMRIVPSVDRTRLELRVERLRDGQQWRKSSGRATLFVDGHVLAIHAGDRVELMASLCRPGKPRNPGVRDYAAHLRGNGRLVTLRSSRPECIKLIDRSTSFSSNGFNVNDSCSGNAGCSTLTASVSGWMQRLAYWPEHVRAAAHDVLFQYLDQRNHGLAAALLLGSRDQVDREQHDAFAETGTIHLLAVSGLHVGILAGIVFAAARLLRLPRGQGLLLVAVSTVAYAVLTGGRPPVVRATILILILCMSYSLARRASPYNSLAAAALVVLALNPADLFSLGAQLSFLAVATIMFFSPRIAHRRYANDLLERVLEEKKPRWQKPFRWSLRWYWHALVLSLVIWIVAAPLVAARFHIVSPGSIVLTPLLLPFVAIALASGVIVLVSGWLLPPLAAMVAVFCDWNLWIIQEIVGAAHRVPYGHFWVAGPAEWWLAGFYGILALAVVLASVLHKRRWQVAAAAMIAWIALGVAVSYLAHAHRCLASTFLSVGHGCAAVVELPDGRTMLYDAGQLSSPDGCAWSVANCLWSRGISQLDAVVISHADADHYNGLPSLMEKIPVDAVYVSHSMFDLPSGSLLALRESIRAAGIPIRYLQAGDRLDRDLVAYRRNGGPSGADANYRIEVLHPAKTTAHSAAARKDVRKHDNSQSIVLLIEHQGCSILLPGDIESTGLDELLARPPLDCDVLLVPHHGSAGSNTPGLAAWCRPEIAVISGSLARDPSQVENAYKNLPINPTPIRVLNTARVGAVRVEIHDGRVCANHVRIASQESRP